jgi:hypothetical protein
MNRGINYKIVYDQTSPDDFKNLKKLCKCFNLFYHESFKPKGLFSDSILRYF